MASSEAGLWTLHRISDAVFEPDFVLRPDANPITLGRGDNMRKQCLGHNVSRLHLELSLDANDNYWTLLDVSSTGTFVNGTRVGKMSSIRLCDGDVIELGSPGAENADPRKQFRYRIQGPSSSGAANVMATNGVAPSHHNAASSNGAQGSRYGAVMSRRRSLGAIGKLGALLSSNGDSKTSSSLWSKGSQRQTKLIEPLALNPLPRSRAASESRVGRTQQRFAAVAQPRGRSTKRGSTEVDLDKLVIAEDEVASGPKLRRMATSMPNLSVRGPTQNGLASVGGATLVSTQPKQLPPNRNSSQQPNSVFGKMPSPDNPFWTMLTWRPELLESDQSQWEDPKSSLQHVPPSFLNYGVYSGIFFRLMLQEMKANVYRDYHTYTKNEPFRLACIINTHSDKDITRMSVVMLSSPENIAPEGWLVVLETPQEAGPSGSGTAKLCFGFVERSAVRLRTAKDEVVAGLISDACPAPSLTHLWEATVASEKQQADKLSPGKPIGMRRVAIVVTSTRLFRAMEVANALPLFHSLLAPKELFDSAAEMFVNQDDGSLSAASRSIVRNNPEQAQAVRAVAQMCTTHLSKPRVALIQGPPGTGKTAVIVAIVIQIFNRWRRLYSGHDLPRILVTAPSNAAVDEIAKRLSQAAQDSNQDFSVIRSGRRSEVRPDVHSIFVDDLVEQELSRRQNSDGLKNLRMEIAERESKIQRLKADLQQLIGGHHADEELAESRISNAKRKLSEEEKFLLRARESLTNLQVELAAKEKESGAFSKMRLDIMHSLYRKADVVATTLSSSLSSQMRQHFLPDNGPVYACGRPFNICIVDEASQCAEPEALVPLALGFTKLVLVGDHLQLPATVLSPLAKDMSYGESLFKRLVGSFEKFAKEGSPPTPPKTPMLTLSTQYRMHPEIAIWPNRHFYDNALVDGPQDRSSPFHPYLLLDLASSSETRSNSGDVCNELEAEFVYKIIEVIREKNTGLSLGIITFYAKQAKLIRSVISARFGAEEAAAMRVSTVDGFQGSEEDVVIVSCVRTKSVGFAEEAGRLNVALTRARHALFVVGNFQVFKSSEMWSNLIRDAVRRGKMTSVETRSPLDILFK